MRIGALAKQYNISIETIRYYISIGLLIPEKKGAQFQFSAQEEEILAMIQHLKSLRFKLSEIRCIIDLKRTSNWVEPATQEAYVRLLREKDGEIGSEIVGLQYVQKQIHKEIKNCVPASTCRSTAGVPIRALPLLCCPWCGHQLTIRSGEFSYKYVTSGELVCPCGYCAHIQDGIVNTGKAYTGTHDSPDLNRNLYHTLNVDFVRIISCAATRSRTGSLPASLPGRSSLKTSSTDIFTCTTTWPTCPRTPCTSWRTSILKCFRCTKR